MRKILFIALFFPAFYQLPAQTVTTNLQKAWQQFSADPQLKHAIASLYVIDAATGQVVFDKNSQVGLAPASTQKIITAATAFELLGKDYRYTTQLVYEKDKKIVDGVLPGNLYVLGTGDPTLGSWRWSTTKDSFLFREWEQSIKRAGIKKINGSIWFAANNFSVQSIPDGWIWQDIGNYYGAGANLLNWKENQYDIVLRSPSSVGSPVEIVSPENKYSNELKTAAKGTGDNAYMYYDGVIKGTIPAGESSFSISAASINPAEELCTGLAWHLSATGISSVPMEKNYRNDPDAAVSPVSPVQVIASHYSPSLDSIVYWFLQKSINLYGEALIKTLGREKNNWGSTTTGVEILTDFWKQKGIDEEELNIGDGSGLSPQDRVTTHAQVEVLKYAKKQSWYKYYYDAFPVYNNMKMKSGTIKDVKGFCGYHKAANGKEYIFSFLVNNYSGSSASVVSKMYAVLNELK